MCYAVAQHSIIYFAFHVIWNNVIIRFTMHFRGRVRFGAAVLALNISAPGLFGARTFFFGFIIP